MAITATTLSGVSPQVVPKVISDPIFNRVIEGSAIMGLPSVRRIPLALNAQTTIPVSMDVPVAGWVDEAGRKPVSSSSIGFKVMTGKKVAVLVPVSQELAMTNTGGLYDQLSQDLPTALARAFDLATLHGITPTNPAAGSGPFGSNYIASTTQSVTLGTAPQNQGGIWADIVGGESVLAGENWDLNGFIGDPRLKPMLKLATDTQGHPLLAAVDSTGPVLDGEPVRWTRAVSGLVNRQAGRTDTLVRLFGGDWTQAAYGIGMDISIAVSNEATYIDTDGTVHSAFQENLVLLRAEAYFGFVMGDSSAFVKYLIPD